MTLQWHTYSSANKLSFTFNSLLLQQIEILFVKQKKSTAWVDLGWLIFEFLSFCNHYCEKYNDVAKSK